MIETLRHEVEQAESLQDLYSRVVVVLHKIRTDEPESRIAFVSGVVSSDGIEHIGGNLQRLRDYSERVRNRRFKYAFSAGDVFPMELINKFLSQGSTNEDVVAFWETLFRNSFVTDMIFTPGFERSAGSQVEKRIALEFGLSMHYINENGIITPMTDQTSGMSSTA